MEYVEPGFWQIVGQLIATVGMLLAYVVRFVGQHLLIITWVVWWLWAVNWRKTWAALGAGGWAPVVLLMLLSALVWSRLEPSDCGCLGAVIIPNFWWQLGAVALLGAIAFFCGWVQGIMHWAPPELDLEPPVHFEHVHDDTSHAPPGKMAPEPHH